MIVLHHSIPKLRFTRSQLFVFIGYNLYSSDITCKHLPELKRHNTVMTCFSYVRPPVEHVNEGRSQ